MDGLDELLSFPSEQDGGGIDGDLNVVIFKDAKDKKVDIYTTPVIMTEKTPDAATIPALSEFVGAEASLAIGHIVAINGEAVRKVITNPKDARKEVKDFLFLLKLGDTYQNVSDINTKQVAFICLFHQLFFLAKLAEYAGFPRFTDSFSDRFNAIQEKLKTEPKKTETIFGATFKDLSTFWDTLVKDISLEPKITFSAIIDVMLMDPVKLYDWFKDTTKGPLPTIAGSVSGNTRTGFDAMSSVAGTVKPPGAPSTTSGASGASAASSVAPGTILPPGAVSPTITKNIEAQFATSGRLPTGRVINTAGEPVGEESAADGEGQSDAVLAAIKANRERQSKPPTPAPIGPQGTRPKRLAAKAMEENRASRPSNFGMPLSRKERGIKKLASAVASDASQQTKEELESVPEVDRETNNDINENAGSVGTQAVPM
jgi:hypothetical protein